MALTLDSAADEYYKPLPSGFTPSGGQLWTMSSFVTFSGSGSANGVFGMGSSGGGGDYISLDRNSSNELKISSQGKTPGDGTNLTASTLYHFCLTWDGTQFNAYLNGSPDYSVTPNSAITWGDIDRIVFGSQLSGGSTSNRADATFAELAMWNVELTDAEIAILAAEISAMCIRTPNLIFYAPLIGDERDYFSNQAWSAATGGVAADHIRMQRKYVHPVYYNVPSAGINLVIPVPMGPVR